MGERDKVIKIQVFTSDYHRNSPLQLSDTGAKLDASPKERLPCKNCYILPSSDSEGSGRRSGHALMSAAPGSHLSPSGLSRSIIRSVASHSGSN